MISSEQRRHHLTGNHHERQNVGGLERLLSVISGVALVAAGGYLVYRGVSGHCATYRALGISTAQDDYAVSRHKGVQVERSVTINRPVAEVYRFWHDFENLPHFMSHLESVKNLTAGRSRWTVRGPAGRDITWEAEIVGDIENEMISWCSLEDADIPNAGSVRFEALPNSQGTVVRVSLKYSPPGGRLGAVVARLFGEEPHQQVADDLRRFKQLMEAGEISTAQGYSTGSGAHDVEGGASEDAVAEASEESFPASDAPGWTGRRSD